jgi:hypothetical protein
MVFDYRCIALEEDQSAIPPHGMYYGRIPFRPIEGFPTQPRIGEVVSLLNAIEFSPNRNFFIFEMDPEGINIESLVALASLPYEVALIRKNGVLWIITGEANNGGRESIEFMRGANCSAHSHLGRLLPSFDDINILFDPSNDNTEAYTFNIEGILRYQRPTRQLIRKKGGLLDRFRQKYNYQALSPQSAEDHFISFINFLAARGIAWSGRKGRQYAQLPDTRKYALQQAFQEITGVIVDTSSWEQTEECQEFIRHMIGQ